MCVCVFFSCLIWCQHLQGSASKRLHGETNFPPPKHAASTEDSSQIVVSVASWRQPRDVPLGSLWLPLGTKRKSGYPPKNIGLRKAGVKNRGPSTAAQDISFHCCRLSYIKLFWLPFICRTSFRDDVLSSHQCTAPFRGLFFEQESLPVCWCKITAWSSNLSNTRAWSLEVRMLRGDDGL